jgi:hypothetical protein
MGEMGAVRKILNSLNSGGAFKDHTRTGWGHSGTGIWISGIDLTSDRISEG